MAKQAMKYDPGRGRELAGSLCAQIAHYLSERVCSQANKTAQAALQRVTEEISPVELLFSLS